MILSGASISAESVPGRSICFGEMPRGQSRRSETEKGLSARRGLHPPVLHAVLLAGHDVASDDLSDTVISLTPLSTGVRCQCLEAALCQSVYRAR